MENVLLQQFRVQLRHAVDGVTAKRCQVCHAHVALSILIDQRQTSHAVCIAGKSGAHVVKVAAVDLVDDLQMTRQKGPEHTQRPLLQGLRQQGVVRIGKRAGRRAPRRIPIESMFVHQQPH